MVGDITTLFERAYLPIVADESKVGYILIGCVGE
jgi:hypothetical protein